MTKLLTKVYGSLGHEGMYLYVAASEELANVPAALLQHFGAPRHAMTLMLSAERSLVHAEASDVLQSIEERGFYLQMSADDHSDEMAAIAARNDKLQRAN